MAKSPWDDFPNNYDAPEWQDLTRRMAKEVGVSEDLLLGILLRGEKSNADQVSETGARGPFQFVPGTRKKLMEKSGVDAWSSPQANAKAAALLVKEISDKYADRPEAERNWLTAAEYNGGPEYYKPKTYKLSGGKTYKYNPKIAIAYANRVTEIESKAAEQETEQGDKQAPPPPQAGGGGIKERITAMREQAQLRRQKQTDDSPASFEAYRRYSEGAMSQEERAAYESSINSGALRPPPGVARLEFGAAKPSGAAVAPRASQAALTRYTAAISNDASVPNRFTEEQVLRFEKRVKEGKILVPEGFQLRQAQGAASWDEFNQRFGTTERTETTAAGLAGAALRGVAPTALGGAIGGVVGGLAGIPAGPPGMAAGAVAGAKTGAGLAAGSDLLLGLANFVTGAELPTPTDAAEAILSSIGVPEPRTKAEKLVQAVTGGASSAAGTAKAAGMLAGQLRAGGRAAQVATKMATDPAKQALLGATGGLGGEAAGQVAQETGVGPTGEAAMRFAGSLAGSSLGGLVPRAAATRITPAAQVPVRVQQQADIAAAQAAGVPLMTTDIAPPRTYFGKRFQQISEAVPIVGTGGKRAVQQEARVASAKSALEDFGAGSVDDLAAKVSQDLADTRGLKVAALKGAKDAVIDRVSKRYVAAVDISRTEQEIQNQLKELSLLSSSGAKAARNFLIDFMDKAKAQPLSVIEKQRKDLGIELDNISRAPPAGLGLDQAGIAKSKIYSAFRDDMEDHIRQHGTKADLKSWRQANKKLSWLASELDDFQELANAINAGDVRTGDIMKMIKSQEPAVLEVLQNNLSPQGQANMRALVVSQVAEKLGGIDKVSPEKFLTQTQKYAKQLGVVLDRQQMDRLKNVQRALSVTRRAAEVSGEAKTGLQGVPFLMGGGLVATVGRAGATAATLSLVSAARALESPTVQRLIARLPDVKPGSPQELELAKRIVVAMGDAAAQNEPERQE